MLLDTPLCNFGWKAPSFELPDAHGNLHKLEDYSGENGTLVVFICNHCPYVIAIIDRLVGDAQALQSEGVNVIAVMSNNFQAYPDDAPEKMIEFAAQHKLSFPYLVDETQKVARAYDAVCTPDFFGFNKDLELQYRGRLDDAKMNDASNRVPELLNAMRQVAQTGKGPQDQVPSMGCSIKWK
jgi:peroxiredoxin